MKTWQAEMAIAATVLATVVVATGRYSTPVEWVGAAAVLLSFGHAQVADRLAEAEAKSSVTLQICTEFLCLPERNPHHYVNGQHILPPLTAARVHCYAWATRYLVSKEVLWLIYFVLHQSWSALAGVGIFLLYPVWRSWWRRK